MRRGQVVPSGLDESEGAQVGTPTLIGQEEAQMILIPAGEYIMGSTEGEGYNDENPQITVLLDAFYIDRCEVSNAQYQQFMDATGHRAPMYWDDEKYNHPGQPVVGVTWHDANAYAKWSRKRIPTEAEWEKAARGTDGRMYPWGNEWDSLKCNSNIGADGYQYPAPVASFLGGASPYGVLDMAGNVWEWCADWYGSNYSGSPRKNPKGHDFSGERVLRGGSWSTTDHAYLRCANRNWFSPDFGFDDAGFRCARDVTA